MTWTAVATYRPRSSRCSELRFNNVPLKDKMSVGSRKLVCSSLHTGARVLWLLLQLCS